MTVYLLWHVGHRNEAGEDGTTLHVEGQTVYIDEQDGDDAKLLGVYSTLEKAEERVRRARLRPGFADEPDCFVIDEYTLDADEWTGGFARVAPVVPDRHS
ncbi:DUF7336 domain-containing protein [Streptomyces naphthomycinicus]|uniref:DUF7336 domain-containing protein n=1 Tax=Streptomyces naphthomycinicus TaxID=2872625 RepID=UPI001CEC3008|nr:hypothetical protein [Streptomyces sp. TML10]